MDTKFEKAAISPIPCTKGSFVKLEHLRPTVKLFFSCSGLKSSVLLYLLSTVLPILLRLTISVMCLFDLASLEELNSSLGTVVVKKASPQLVLHL